MCHKLLKLSTVLSFTILFAFPAVARGQLFSNATQNFQTKANRENAPYSRFGIGEFRNGINPLLRGMGSISSAYSSPIAVNTDNPASYAGLMYTTYEGSLKASTRTVHSGSDKFSTGMASINHFNIGIPVGKIGGLCIGYKPVTHIYYNLQDTSDIAGYGRGIRTFFGDGSLNYAFIGAGFKYKGLSVGANFGYLFGTTVYANVLENIDNKKVNDAQFVQIVQTGGVYWKGGAMYSTRVGQNLFLRAGATLTLSQSMNSEADNFWVSYNSSGGDTAFSNLFQRGKLTMPMMYSAGIQLADSNKWLLGIDFSAADWSQYQSLARVDSVTDMSYKIGIGGQYTPDETSLRKYFNRVNYRLGFYYGKDYVDVRNTPINYYAVTFGLGLPFKQSLDRINTAFEIGQRGSESNGLFRESFVKFSIGITLNASGPDRWFIKRKYD